MKTRIRLLGFMIVIALAAAAKQKESQVQQLSVAASIDAVKGAAVARLTTDGYRLDTDSQFQMVFKRDERGAGMTLAKGLFGSADCPMPRRVITFTFVQQGDAVTLTGLPELEIGGATCPVSRSVLDSKKDHKALQDILANIKTSAESKVQEPKQGGSKQQ